MIKKIYLLIFLLLSLIIGLGGVVLYITYQETIYSPLQPDKNPVISIQRGANINSIAKELEKRGIIKNRWMMILYARLSGIANYIQAGDYQITSEKTLHHLLEDMVEGKVIVYNITVIEGKTFQDLLHNLADNPNLKHTLSTKKPAEIASMLGIKNHNPEGWFLPETYQFQHNTTDFALLKRMHEAMEQYLNQAWAERAENLPFSTPYEALILASIVEKETGLANERQQVAGVFVRRLQKNMLLQTDPTVIYGAKNYQGVITREHLQTDTPYNTYTRKGLPPTPIALPSKASIDAALHPDDGKSLYFVATGKGGHTFSETYEEHKKAVAAYRQWQKTQQ